jgi:geranylgeranyl diphosphate synthase type II
LFAKSYEYLLGYQGKELPALVSLLTKTAIEICEGQQMDLDFEQTEKVDIEEYITMIRLKTAVVLAACLKAGAIVASASEKEQQMMYDFGIKIGLAFQIQDDLLDVYADVAKFGKNLGGDIAENKKTYMSLKAMELAQGEDAEMLHHYFSSLHFDREEKFVAVKSIYEKYKVKEAANVLINRYYSSATDLLQQINKPQSSKQALIDFVNLLLGRDY